MATRPYYDDAGPDLLDPIYSPGPATADDLASVDTDTHTHHPRRSDRFRTLRAFGRDLMDSGAEGFLLYFFRDPAPTPVYCFRRPRSSRDAWRFEWLFLSSVIPSSYVTDDPAVAAVLSGDALPALGRSASGDDAGAGDASALPLSADDAAAQDHGHGPYPAPSAAAHAVALGDTRAAERLQRLLNRLSHSHALFWTGSGLIIFAALFIRIAVGQYSYSGAHTPPMYGDFEAQRHWMEVTRSLPVCDWYRSTRQNDLLYWGLDYPPLSAYWAWMWGALSDAVVGPSATAQFTSRGHESLPLKMFMRWSVLVSDVLILFPAILHACWSLYKRYRSSSRALVATALLLQPALLIIDHGHFQYNGVSVGLVLWTTALVLNRDFKTAALAFVGAFMFKIIALYHALPVFAVMLGAALRIAPAEAETEAETETGAEAEAKARAKADTKTKVGTEAKAAAGAGTEAGKGINMAVSSPSPLPTPPAPAPASAPPTNTRAATTAARSSAAAAAAPYPSKGADTVVGAPLCLRDYPFHFSQYRGRYYHGHYPNPYATPPGDGDVSTSSSSTLSSSTTSTRVAPLRVSWAAFWRVFSIGLVVIASLTAVLLPFLLFVPAPDSPDLPLGATRTPADLASPAPRAVRAPTVAAALAGAGHVLRRIFPVGRHIFEDKVANFWCVSSVVLRWKERFTPDQLAPLSVLLTLLASLPACLDLFWRPTSRRFVYAMTSTAFAFFLFSFQVHEKSIIYPVTTLTLLLLYHPRLVVSAVSAALFSLYPLLRRDGLTVPYILLHIVWLMGSKIQSVAQYRVPPLFAAGLTPVAPRLRGMWDAVVRGLTFVPWGATGSAAPTAPAAAGGTGEMQRLRQQGQGQQGQGQGQTVSSTTLPPLRAEPRQDVSADTADYIRLVLLAVHIFDLLAPRSARFPFLQELLFAATAFPVFFVTYVFLVYYQLVCLPSFSRTFAESEGDVDDRCGLLGCPGPRAGTEALAATATETGWVVGGARKVGDARRRRGRGKGR